MNSLVEFYPELLEEWDYEKNIVKPQEISYGSGKKVWWRCKKGHSWRATPHSRTNMKRGCPICAKSKLSGKASIMATHPELMKEWDHEKNIIKPEEISYGSGKKVWWKCKRGHSWAASPNSRTAEKTGCPKCNLRKIINENTLVTTHPELLEEWDYEKNIFNPQEISYGSARKVWWKCKKGHSWQASLNSRTGMKTGCRKCRRKRS